MVYCKECVRSGRCFNSGKTLQDSIECHKYKDRNYNSCSSDGDCDAVSERTFGNLVGIFAGLDRNNIFRDVERVALSCS